MICAAICNANQYGWRIASYPWLGLPKLSNEAQATISEHATEAMTGLTSRNAPSLKKIAVCKLCRKMLESPLKSRPSIETGGTESSEDSNIRDF
jgi:hypothetical protein